MKTRHCTSNEVLVHAAYPVFYYQTLNSDAIWRNSNENETLCLDINPVNIQASISLHLHPRVAKKYWHSRAPKHIKIGLVFLGIHHLSVRELDEIISIGKIKKMKKT